MAQYVADRMASPAGSAYGATTANEVEGSYQRVLSLADRDALPSKILIEGKTTCYVENEDRLYLWSGGEWILALEDVGTRVRSLEYDLVTSNLPADGVPLVRDNVGTVALSVRPDGSLAAYIRLNELTNEREIDPGDDISLLEDLTGRVAVGVRADGSLIAHVRMQDIVPQTEPPLPGDPMVLAADRNGRAALLIEADGTLRARIPLSELVDEQPVPLPGDGAELAIDSLGTVALSVRADGSLAARLRMEDLVSQTGRPLPGDSIVLAADRNGRAAVWVDPDGTLRSRILLSDLADEQPVPLPGDGVDLLIDCLGRAVLSARADGSLAAILRMEDILPRYPVMPGDPIPLLIDRIGKAALYADPDGNIRGRYLVDDIVDFEAVVTTIAEAVVEEAEGGGSGGGTIEVAQPETLADAFHAFKVGEAIFYLSRQWRGELYGFEQRGDPAEVIPVTLAQSPRVGSVVASFGGGSLGVQRPLSERYEWHIRDNRLVKPDLDDATQTFAAVYLTTTEAAGLALPTILIAPQVVGSTTEADALPDSPYRQALNQSVAAARDALVAFGKVPLLDTVLLQLLDGAPDTDEITADYHYAGTAKSLRDELAAEQSMAPFFVVNQTFSSRADGTSEVILAEGLLDQRHFDLNFVIATPLYWCTLEDGTAASLDPDSALLVSELQGLAVFEREQGRDWICPRLQDARLSGSTVTVRFVALADLVLDDPVAHGFAIDGITNGAAIASVTPAGRDVVIELDAAPEGDLVLRYAWGETGDPGDGKPANRGALRDAWQAESVMAPGTMLYRRALAGRATIFS